MIKFIQGDCLERLQELEDNSIDCVVSSPPYYGLRDYANEPQIIGGNKDCNHIWQTFKRDGNCWGIPNRNIDGQAQTKKTNNSIVKEQEQKKCSKCDAWIGQLGLEPTYQEYIANTVKVFETFKPKLKETATIWWNVGDSYSSTRWSNTPSTTGISQKHSDIVLKKIIDIPEKSLMMIPNRVAIALQMAGWYIRSEIIWHKPNPMPESVRDRPTSCHEKIWLITKNKKYYYDADAIREPTQDSYNGKRGLIKKRYKIQSAMQDRVFNLGYSKNLKRNKRNVWTITTKSFKQAHFATFPPDLIEPCIKAGCPENGIVLDPFGGAGTTGIVAKSLNRQSILIELNPKYIKIAKKRAENEFGLFNEILLTS